MCIEKILQTILYIIYQGYEEVRKSTTGSENRKTAILFQKKYKVGRTDPMEFQNFKKLTFHITTRLKLVATIAASFQFPIALSFLHQNQQNVKQKKENVKLVLF